MAAGGTSTELNQTLSVVGKLKVFDKDGGQIDFECLYKDRKAIIIFVREASVHMVVIGCAPYKFIKGFITKTGYPYDVYCDSEQAVYKALGMIRSLKIGAGSEHVKSSKLYGTLRSTWETLKSLEMQGDVKQQGGQMVIGPGEQVHYVHFDTGSTDHAPINTVLEAAGVKKVVF